jgi:hypothetical protein
VPAVDRNSDVSVSQGTASAWRQCEADLAAVGRALPLPNRTVWADAHGAATASFVAVRDADRCAFGFAVYQRRTRALPGHRTLYCQRVAVPPDPNLLAQGVAGLVNLSRSLPRVLRVSFETFSVDPATADSTAAVCMSAGFRRVPSDEMFAYEDTILIDLSPSPEAILSEFHSTGRRHIRAVEKNPVALRSIDASYDDRLDSLLRETMSRTGGTFNRPDWNALRAVRDRDPASLRIVGLFDTRRAFPSDLLAFAVAYNHGDVVEYATAGSTRETDLKMPLAYGVAWDLIRWARDVGARWFDFGGVTAGSHDSSDPVGGISDFKRYFSKNVARVGSEWVFEPHPGRATVARIAAGIAHRIRSAR